MVVEYVVGMKREVKEEEEEEEEEEERLRGSQYSNLFSCLTVWLPRKTRLH